MNRDASNLINELFFLKKFLKTLSLMIYIPYYCNMFNFKIKVP